MLTISFDPSIVDCRSFPLVVVVELDAVMSSCCSLNEFWRDSVTSFPLVLLSFTLQWMERWLLTAIDSE